MIDILVVDDHRLIREAIVRLLSDVEGFRPVSGASSGEEALQKCRTAKPDIVLMDTFLPGVGGLEATRRISQSFPGIRVIGLGNQNSLLYPIKLIEAGASGFVSKHAASSELIDAVRQVIEGRQYISSELAQQIAIRSLQPETHSPFENLSSREMQVALMVVQGGKAKQIANQLCLSTKTVNSYRYRIFDKLKISGDVELTHQAIRCGLVQLGQEHNPEVVCAETA